MKLTNKRSCVKCSVYFMRIMNELVCIHELCIKHIEINRVRLTVFDGHCLKFDQISRMKQNYQDHKRCDRRKWQFYFRKKKKNDMRNQLRNEGKLFILRCRRVSHCWREINLVFFVFHLDFDYSLAHTRRMACTIVVYMSFAMSEIVSCVYSRCDDVKFYFRLSNTEWRFGINRLM